MPGHSLTAFSGKDNASIDIGRVLLAVATLAVIGLEGFAVVARGQPYDAAAFALALGGLLFGGCASLAVKRATEPDPCAARGDENRGRPQ